MKKTVRLEPTQEEIVKRVSRDLKMSESEVIRTAIAAYGKADAAQVAADTARVMRHLQEHPEWDDDPSTFFHG